MLELLSIFISLSNFIPIVFIENPVIQLILIIWSVLVLVFEIIFIIWRWFQEAKKDGKITVDEVEDLFEQIDDKINNKGGE